LIGIGIRGVLSLHILARIEELLIKESYRPDHRPAGYFDYLAETSTGGIVAAGIAAVDVGGVVVVAGRRFFK
jgi:patatin-like phospholipase/acyl hydrolase